MFWFGGIREAQSSTFNPFLIAIRAEIQLTVVCFMEICNVLPKQQYYYYSDVASTAAIVYDHQHYHHFHK